MHACTSPPWGLTVAESPSDESVAQPTACSRDAGPRDHNTSSYHTLSFTPVDYPYSRQHLALQLPWLQLTVVDPAVSQCFHRLGPCNPLAHFPQLARPHLEKVVTEHAAQLHQAADPPPDTNTQPITTMQTHVSAICACERTHAPATPITVHPPLWVASSLTPSTRLHVGSCTCGRPVQAAVPAVHRTPPQPHTSAHLPHLT